MNKCDQCIVRELTSLKALSKDEVVQLANSKTTRSIKKGEVLFEEGEVTNGVFCVKDGIGKLSKLSANGKDQIIKLVKAGELLGQRSMISNEPANLSAKAVLDMEVCFIPKRDIIHFFNNNNQFSMNLMQLVFDDLKRADDHSVDMTQKTVKERLAETLLYLKDTFGVNDDQSLKAQLSREELASVIGTATESCIRLLSDFKKAGLIELKGKMILLIDIAALKKAAN
jgi:CRP-like cAMP-binding protein